MKTPPASIQHRPKTQFLWPIRPDARVAAFLGWAPDIMAMWRRGAGHLPVWLQHSGFHSSNVLPSRVVAAEVAQLVSLQTSGMVELPLEVQQGIDQAAAETNRKMVKDKGQQLAQRLRHMSRTKHRGGVHPNLKEQQQAAAQELQPARRGKGKTRRQMLHEMSRAAPLPVAMDAKPDVDSYWGRAQREAAAAVAEADEERVSRREAASLYDEAAALAYGATRLPACYAALHRVLSEVKGRRPGWQPGSMLDFGAGPATATWAAQQVWREEPLQATAVEPSASMTWLGQRVLATHQEGYREGMARLAERHRRQQQQQQQQEQQVGEGQAGSAAEAGGTPAAQGVQVQWQATWRGRPLSWERLGGQGKGTGSAAGAEQPLEGWEAAGPALAEGMSHGQGDWEGGDLEHGSGAGSEEEGSFSDVAEEEEEEEEEEGLEPVPPPRIRWMSRLAPKSRSQGGGRRYDLVVAAYVLGEMRSTQERRKAIEELWQRTEGLLVLVEPGTPAGFTNISAARTQVLEGGRPAGGGGSSASGGEQAAHVLAPCPHDGACPLESRRSWCHFVQRFQRTGLQRLSKSVGGKSARTYQDERFSYVVLARGPRPEEVRQVAVAGSLVRQPDDLEAYLNVPDNLAPRSIGRAAALDAVPEQQQVQEEDGGESDLDEATRQLILESIMADADDDEAEESAALAAQLQELFQLDASPESTEASRDTEEQQQPQQAQQDTAPAASAAQQQQQQQQQQPMHEDGEGGASGEEEGDWAEEDPSGLAAAVESSVVWSRVLRTPRKRSGHVVLDLCSAVQADGSPAPEGTLLRQIVSKGSAQRELGGTAPYRLARSVRWGDLWPLYYQRRLKAAEPPAAEAFQQD